MSSKNIEIRFTESNNNVGISITTQSLEAKLPPQVGSITTQYNGEVPALNGTDVQSMKTITHKLLIEIYYNSKTRDFKVFNSTLHTLIQFGLFNDATIRIIISDFSNETEAAMIRGILSYKEKIKGTTINPEYISKYAELIEECMIFGMEDNSPRDDLLEESKNLLEQFGISDKSDESTKLFAEVIMIIKNKIINSPNRPVNNMTDIGIPDFSLDDIENITKQVNWLRSTLHKNASELNEQTCLKIIKRLKVVTDKGKKLEDDKINETKKFTIFAPPDYKSPDRVDIHARFGESKSTDILDEVLKIMRSKTLTIPDFTLDNAKNVSKQINWLRSILRKNVLELDEQTCLEVIKKIRIVFYETHMAKLKRIGSIPSVLKYS